jgi:4-amino-4-deoxy-L-arabinose transferase-like glycosyltransferase
MKSSGLSISLLVALAGALLFIPFLGSVHLFDWDEINFAECAREMIASSDYSSAQINFFPFWEKPPVFIWMQVLSMKAFGINEFAARFPNALCGIVTLVIVFNIGRKLYGTRFGLLWALAFAGSLLPHFYFKSGIIDPWFNLFIFLGIYRFILYTNEYDVGPPKRLFDRNILLSAFFIALAVLTKGPVALLVFGICFFVFLLMKRRAIMSWQHLLLFCITAAGFGGLWFIILILKGRSDIILEFIVYQIRLLRTADADHGGPVYYHWVVLLIGCFPASILAIRGFNKNEFDTPFQKHFKRWMSILFWVVLILFSLVQTKIVHYSSLCYFPLTFLAAYTAHKLMTGEIVWKRWMTILTAILGGTLGILLTSLQFVAAFKMKIIAAGLIDDKFAEANLLSDVHWYGWEFLIGILFLAGVLSCLILEIRKKISTAILSLFILTLLATDLSALVFAQRVEGYSQRAALEFYESLKEKDCYIDVAGFKSYAHLFYSRKKPEANQSPLFFAFLKTQVPTMSPGVKLDPKVLDNTYSYWLKAGPIDKPVYIVCKNVFEAEFREKFPLFRKLYAKNGFVFFLREK